MNPQAAVDLPNFGSRNGPTELEAGTEAEGWRAALEAKGHQVRLMDMTSEARRELRPILSGQQEAKREDRGSDSCTTR